MGLWDSDGKANTTTTVTQISPQNPTYGQPITFTAKVSAAGSSGGTPTGPVSFSGMRGLPRLPACRRHGQFHERHRDPGRLAQRYRRLRGR